MGLRAVTALLILAVAGGCATITSGTTQDISVDSEPQGAECALSREGAQLASVTTPGPVTIKRHAATIHVVCRKEGHEPGRTVMNSRYETASAGNFILGGIIGVMIDNSSGANTRYDTYVMVRLEPEIGGRPVHAAPSPQVTAAPPPPPTRFDGDYGGGVDLGQNQLRRIEIRVLNGQGAGTAGPHACQQPGAARLAIAPSGAITGEFDVLTAGCNPQKGSVAGRVDGDRLLLSIDLDGNKREFSLTRRAGLPVSGGVTPPPPASGQSRSRL